MDEEPGRQGSEEPDRRAKSEAVIDGLETLVHTCSV